MPTPLRDAVASRDFHLALTLALELEPSIQPEALHYIVCEASITSFDPDVLRSLTKREGWALRQASIIPMVPNGPFCIAYLDPDHHPRLRRRFVEVGRLAWRAEGTQHCHGGWAFADPRALFVLQLSCGLRYATFAPAEHEWGVCAPTIGPWHAHKGKHRRSVWGRAIQWGASRIIEEVSFSEKLAGKPRADLLPAESVADHSYSASPMRDQRTIDELYTTATMLQTGTPPDHWAINTPTAARSSSSPFPINTPTAMFNKP